MSVSHYRYATQSGQPARSTKRSFNFPASTHAADLPGTANQFSLSCVSCFNRHQLMEPLRYVPPAEYEANYYRQQTAQAVPQA